MWTVRAADVSRLQSPGGDRFTQFVDALIRTHAFVHGLAQSCVRTNERTNQQDGGVDTHVSEAVPADAAGWLPTPTCWQYKAQGHASTTIPSLVQEVGKHHARALIQQGRAYRLAICDSVPDSKITTWRTALSVEIQKWAPQAPAPDIVTADDLATWASAYPGIVARFFRPGLQDVLSLEAWGKNIASLTPSYVPVQDWSEIEQALERHVDFSLPSHDPIWVLEGEAGVGKTRLVHEVISKAEGASGLVVYTADELQARTLARLAAAQEQVRAVLVADECTLQSRLSIQDALMGHRDRVRVVAIHNETREVRGGAPRPRLDRIPSDVVRTILSRNFPHVPDGRRSRYVDLSGGFVRLAADLCDNDHLLAAGEPLDCGLPSIQDYYERRLPNQKDRDAMGVVALLARVGFREDVRAELAGLCEAVGDLDARGVLQRAERLKDSPGFLAMGGRYLYVTPKIVATIAFQDAWERWLRHDLNGFLERLPSDLIPAFQDRIAASAPQGVRETVSSYFRDWAMNLTPNVLEDVPTVRRLETLVETSPGTYLPVLEALVTGSDDLTAVRGHGWMGGWGPRRYLVWLMERIVALPEHFHSAEAILFHLALHENEERIGNNATEIWKQIHRPYLSGTATPFADRIKVLEGRVFSAIAEERRLAVQALDPIFERSGITRRGHPAIIAGRIPPDDWVPTTRAEAEECMSLPLSLLIRMRQASYEDLADKALEVLLERLGSLLYDGQATLLRQVVETAPVSEAFQARLTARLEQFLRRDAARAIERKHVDEEYKVAVQAWRDSLKPLDLRGNLMQAMLATPSWDREGRDRWSTEVSTLARELIADPGTLRTELSWLTGDDARGAGTLGFYLGQHDDDATLLDLLINPTQVEPDRPLCCGFITGLLAHHPQHASRVNELLDGLEKTSPQAALNLALASRANTTPLRRALRLVDQGVLPARVLGAFSLDLDGHKVEVTDVREMLQRLTSGPDDDEETRAANLHVGLEILSFQLQRRTEEKLPGLLVDPDVREAVWTFLSQPGELRRHNDAYHWQQVVAALAESEPERAARAAASALVADRLGERRAAVEVLQNLNTAHPGLIIKEFGAALLHPEHGYRCVIGRETRSLVEALDVELLGHWLRGTGVEAARRIAPALPLPSVTDDGELVVPPVTQLVLKEYGSDEKTLREFCLGGHSLELYSGDIAGQHEAQADVARLFLSHPLLPIRRWAQYELETSLAQARRWRREDEEERSLE